MRYLSGIDWMLAALDARMRSAGGAGNSSQIVVELAGTLDPGDLAPKLREFLAAFPVLSGRPARNPFNLAPYWKRVPAGGREDTPLKVHHLSADATAGEATELLAACVNTPFPDEETHVFFHLVLAGARRCYLAMTFDHKLLDARGAELFLDRFRRHLAGDAGALTPGSRADEAPAGLSGWTDKFRAGQTVNRKVIALGRTGPRTLPAGRPGGMKFRIVPLGREETAAVLARAQEAAGPLMEIAYFLATATAAMHRCFERKKVPGESYVIPVTVDVRPPDDPEEAVFFNYSSFFFFRIPAASVERRAAIAAVKKEMFEQVQIRLPEKLARAAMLMRIVPLRILGRMTARFFGARLASFTFGYLGKSALEKGAFGGRKIENVFHMPRMPAPPGVGVFLNLWRGRINAVFSWNDGVMTAADIDEVAGGLKESL